MGKKHFFPKVKKPMAEPQAQQPKPQQSQQQKPQAVPTQNPNLEEIFANHDPSQRMINIDTNSMSNLLVSFLQISTREVRQALLRRSQEDDSIGQ